MAKNDAAKAGSGIRWDALHKVITAALAVATTVLGVWQFQLQHKLDVEQARLKQQTDRTRLVNDMLTRIEGYVTKTKMQSDGEGRGGRKRGLTETDKTRILISLLKIAAEVHLEQTGQLEKEEQKNLVRAIPLHFALLSDNDEMLVTIGSTPEDLDLWLPFARAAADPDIKETAAIALERISALSTDGKVHARIIEALVELTVDWQVPELSSPVARALRSVLDRLDEEDVKDIPELAQAVSLAKEKFDLLKLVQETVTDAGAGLDQPKVDAVQPEIIEQVSQVFEEVRVLPSVRPNIEDLIKQLGDEDKNTRRSARSRIGSVGAEAVPTLFEALEARGDEYRIRLGVVTALLFMESPITIPRDKMPLVTDLLGDSDSTVRKNTARFLIAYLRSHGEIADANSGQTIERALEALSNNLSNYDNANAVYNSVVVLGEAMKQAPESSAEKIRKLLVGTKAELAQDPRKWRKTVAQVDTYLE